MCQKTYSTSEIAQQVAGRLSGNGQITITGVNEIKAATPGQLTFVGTKAYANQWPSSRASAALVSQGIDVASRTNTALIVVDDADLAMATVLALFAPPVPQPAVGIAKTAYVDPTAALGKDVAIGHHCYVGPHVTLGDGCVLHCQVSVYDHTTLGKSCQLWPGCVIRERCQIGDQCIFHSNVVIGADGFGYRPDTQTGQLVKIPQIGTVQIGNHVEIGSGSCVDRGKFGATTLGDGCKIDNLVHIAHNCILGNHCIIIAQTGLGGSVTVQDHAVIGGQVAIRDHINVGKGAQIGSCSGVMTDVPPGAQWLGIPARDAKAVRRHWVGLMRNSAQRQKNKPHPTEPNPKST